MKLLSISCLASMKVASLSLMKLSNYAAYCISDLRVFISSLMSCWSFVLSAVKQLRYSSGSNLIRGSLPRMFWVNFALKSSVRAWIERPIPRSSLPMLLIAMMSYSSFFYSSLLLFSSATESLPSIRPIILSNRAVWTRSSVMNYSLVATCSSYYCLAYCWP